jgi:hypothetical protein
MENTGLNIHSPMQFELPSQEALTAIVQEAVFKSVTFAFSGQVVAVGLSDKIVGGLIDGGSACDKSTLTTVIDQAVESNASQNDPERLIPESVYATAKSGLWQNIYWNIVNAK